MCAQAVTLCICAPQVVDHSRVNLNPTMVFKQTENCNYAVDLAKAAFHFSLVGTPGMHTAPACTPPWALFLQPPT